MSSLQDKVWVRLWKENAPELRERVIKWRKQNAITRIDKPSRIQRARRLGYKAKQGIIVVRMRVGTGGMRKQRPTGGRRPKHLGVTRIKADDNMKKVAEDVYWRDIQTWSFWVLTLSTRMAYTIGLR